MIFNQEKAKANEREVMTLLKKTLGGSWKMPEDEYSVYDISGVDRDGNKILVEVKQRSKLYPKMYIESQKIKDIGVEYKKLHANRVLLVNSVDGKHYVYDIKYITDNCKLITREMNLQTSDDLSQAGQKVTKEVYEFGWDVYMLELTEGKLGHLYESIK